ncbi:hypothetical protein MTBSS4_190069 [Magnetospirillum sp. SS-4]|nr:hypothetical protein MTBSS4_190069 [Magnetospirillum sp. SS-4]
MLISRSGKAIDGSTGREALDFGDAAHGNLPSHIRYDHRHHRRHWSAGRMRQLRRRRQSWRQRRLVQRVHGILMDRPRPLSWKD